MLDETMQKQLKEYFSRLEKPVELALHSGEHEKRAELVAMLDQLADLSPLIRRTEASGKSASALSFDLYADGQPTGIRFSGIPGGHEFSSLVLAILQTGGSPIRLDAGVQETVKGLKGRLHFQTVVSLSCHNCPDVVQTLNSLALLSAGIQHEMIDGALYPDFVHEHGVQGVPAVFLNGQPFASGKVDAGLIIDRLIQGSGEKPAAASTGRKYDVAVVGGGPGGVAAAIYSVRKGLAVTLIADRIGGQVKDTMAIENLITVQKTTGPELTGSFATLLQSHDIDVRENLRVEEIVNDESTKTLVLNTGERIEARAIILAPGARWKELNVPGEREFLGRGVAYCPHCDGPFFKDKDVAVIGGGNSGVEAALDLAGIVRSVKVFEFAEHLNADQILQNQLRARANIEVVTSAQVSEILHDQEKVTGLRYKDRSNSQEKELTLDGVFIQIGLVPHTAFVAELVQRNRYGEIIIDERGQTSVPGIFACGDATTTPYKQIAIAVGDGARASIAAFEYLLKLPTAAAAA